MGEVGVSAVPARRLYGSLRAFRSVAANPDLRRLELAFIGFNMAEQRTWIAILVYAFLKGGATAAGLVALIQLAPAAVFAPIASSLGDRTHWGAWPSWPGNEPRV